MTPQQPLGPDNGPNGVPIPPATGPTTPAAGDMAAHFIAAELARARVALQRTRILAVLTVLLVGGDLIYITAKFHDSAQPQNAAAIANGMVMEQLDEHDTELADQIKQRVPMLIEQAPDYLLHQMPTYRQTLEDNAIGSLNGYFKSAATPLGQNLDTFLGAHQDDVKQMLLDSSDQTTVDKVGGDLRQQLQASLQTAPPGGVSVSAQISQSLQSLQDVRNTIHRLATAKDLTPDEKKTRHALAIIAATIQTNKGNLTLPTGTLPTVNVASDTGAASAPTALPSPVTPSAAPAPTPAPAAPHAPGPPAPAQAPPAPKPQ